MKRHLKLLQIILLIGALVLLVNGRFTQADHLPTPPPPPTFPPQPTTTLVPPQAVAGDSNFVYLPLVLRPEEIGPWVDTQNRSQVVTFYQTEYLASEGVPHGWAGSVGSCNPGSTSAAFKEAVLRRINFFRAMAGVPAVQGFAADYNSKAQAAALMMSAQNDLSHAPDTSWACYTAAGAEGAGSSNLYLGVYGPSAISGYIYDPGGGNYFVGHRRWILYPQTKFMGTGDIPATAGKAAANALWVFDSANMWGPRPDTREAFVAWPPPGYVPYQVVYPRWSFAYAGADFSGASVTMSKNGSPLSATVSPVANGYGENTLVWEPGDSFGSAPGSDITYQVTLNNVVIGGSPQSFSYQVIVINPGP